MRGQQLLHLMVLLSAWIAVASANAETYKFVRQWGTSGSAAGQLSWPSGLALDRHGHIYVTELNNDRVQRFNLDGTFVSKWGGSGSGAGQFVRPEAVAIDTSGNVYVTDSGNNRVQKFRADGQFISQWGHYGLAEGDFQHTTGIAADTIGNVYVADYPDIFLLHAEADTISERVQKFTNTGSVLTQWGGIGSGPGQFNNPHGMALDRSGHVFVCDYFNDRIQKFSLTGGYISQWGSNGTNPGRFQGPAAVAVDRLGNVFVCDYQNNRVQKFSNTGAFITQWGSTGSGAGEFSGPDAIAVDDSGNVYVAETDNDRIQVFSPSPHVLLVHGICGRASSWATFAQVLSDSGYTVHTVQLEPDTTYSKPPRAYVAALAAKLDSIGSDHVGIVAHSMGGLVTREYMRRHTQSRQMNRVGQLVTLGTPHHGNDLGPWLLGFKHQIDAGCTLVPCADKIRNIGGCQGDPRTRVALHDMTPGSVFLNLLNYGTQTALYDTAGSNGWDGHQSETQLVPSVYYASVAGTRSFCKVLNFEATQLRWGKGASYRPNDGVVATASAMLTNAEVFRAQDVDLPTRMLTHAPGPLLCGLPYYLSDTLGRKVSSILANAPAGPPVAGLRAEALNPITIQATAEDSLRSTPAIVDTIAVGHLDTPTRSIPATTQMMVALLSDDAHLKLQTPTGTIITPSDTSTVGGIFFFNSSGSGFEGYVIDHPMAGTWTFQIDATGAASLQEYGCFVNYASPIETKLWTRTPSIQQGDSLRVRAQVTNGGSRRTDITWSCRVIDPNETSTTLALFDDGAHGDSLSGDGIYGNKAAPGGGIGLYRIDATATAPAAGVFSAGTTCELVYNDDLSVPAEKIWFSPNWFNAGDSVVVYATVRNTGSRAAMGVTVTIRDDRLGIALGTSVVDIPAAGEVMVQVPWKAAVPDTHTFEVTASPYVFESEVSYSNNVAERTVILGTPVSVDPSGPSGRLLWFGPPWPNPSNGVVEFTFQLTRPGTATVEVFDVLGRRIRRWIWKDLPAGMHSIDWNGRSESGSTIAPGVLLCRLSAEGQMRSRKLVFRP